MSFTATYGGKCGGCGRLFNPGEEISYGGGTLLLAVDCCGDADPSEFHVRPPATQPVLPRGKTKADRCGVCFQVPASNGACGCFE